MIRGLAQVIGMKPIFRSVFSRLPPFSWAIASSAPKGTRVEIAAQAVDAPTTERKRRRSPSSGKMARITAPCTTRRLSPSTSPGASAASCSACEPWLPQLQRESEVCESNGSCNDMVWLPRVMDTHRNAFFMPARAKAYSGALIGQEECAVHHGSALQCPRCTEFVRNRLSACVSPPEASSRDATALCGG